MGGMKIHKNITFKVITAIFFPPAILAITFKSAKEIQYMPQTQEEHEQELEGDPDYYNNFMESSSSRGSQESLNDKLVGYSTKIGSHNLVEKINFKTSIHDQDGNGSQRVVNDRDISLGQIIELIDANNFDKNDDKLSKLVHQLDNQTKTKKNSPIYKKRNKLRFGKKIYEFYNSPVTKFYQFLIMYCIFLFNFAYIVLVKTPVSPSPSEIFVFVYLFTYGLDKIRQLFQIESPRFAGKLKIYFSRRLNTYDILFILSIIVAMGFRLSPVLFHHKIARLIYCVNTIYWIVKLMEFLLIKKRIGTLIIIASRMVIF
jgi:hypothetical protein